MLMVDVFGATRSLTRDCAQWPVGEDECAQRLDCAALGWAIDANGGDLVCGSSHYAGQCVHEASDVEASNICEEMGGRLCTAREIEQGEGDPSACDYDSIFRWSWASAAADVCPANQSLGVAGSSGSWFSFSSAEKNATYEIQLRSTEASRFVLLGIFDESAELVRGEPPSVHSRIDGAMLRWNSSQTEGRVFVHASNLLPESIDVPFSVVVVVPPTYSWQATGISNSGFGAADIDVQHNRAVSIDLPFGFEYYGISYSTIWVSSAGYIAFEPPVQGKAFAGADTVFTAILAAAGDFDTGRAGARVTATPATQAGVQVSWHAPLFASREMSDVSINLHPDSTITISWNRVDLTGGGSLRY